MLRLRTFGGLSLTRGTENLTGAATQRRRLAILVLLAAAGEGGLGRDKLLAYLWPESDAARARHVLNQLLYAQRRQAGEALFLGQKTLRLNPAVITTDLGDFERAMAAGDLLAAVETYAGPFLDGFFLKDAPEFEQWVEGQRARLAQRCLGALRGLAEPAAGRGAIRDAVDWWRRAAALDPYDATVALELVRALASAGDRPGALRHARLHIDALRSELGVTAERAMIDLVEQLRRA